MTPSANAFSVQRAVRGPWRRYLDPLADHRPALHACCRWLTGNVWDGEDLVQDTLVRVFSLLGKSDTRLENPKAYLIRTATNLWIDRMRRAAREQAALALEQAEPASVSSQEPADIDSAAGLLFQRLHPQERAAFLMKDVFDLSLDEAAALLGTTVGAVKTALNGARGRLDRRRPAAALEAPPRALVEQFLRALAAKDLVAMKALCAEHVSAELVGGAELESFEQARAIFTHAHLVMPRLGFGTGPRWTLGEYDGEAIVLGFQTLDGGEGLNEIHRIEALGGRIVRIRTYCFCPETLAVVAEAAGCRALPRPYRSPSIEDALRALLGFRPLWRRRQPGRLA
jgi:RNA polymerase sigma-70 factor (ECF subfamily)